MSARRGFTLIELLIVMAIIVLLVAVFLPTLGMVTDALVRLECKTNLKKIHNYLLAYASRFESQLPGFGYENITESVEGSIGGTPAGRHLMVEMLMSLGAQPEYFCCPANPLHDELASVPFDSWAPGAYRKDYASKWYNAPGYAFFTYTANFRPHPSTGDPIPNRWDALSRFSNGRFMAQFNDDTGNPPIVADVLKVYNAYGGFWHDRRREPVSGDEFDTWCVAPGGGGHTLFLGGDVIWYDWGELEAQGTGYQSSTAYYYLGMLTPDE